ncbi:hypothetical protein [Tenacibaculum sp. C7A-26P2]|uniref:hypothetical protein n=1 Tax=Tenacibaculum sp. C7A-26P2 TaxID=3447504 RepID=UPI003F82D1E3
MRKLSFLLGILVTGLFMSCTDTADENLTQLQQLEVEQMSTGGVSGGNTHDPDPEPEPRPKKRS